MILFMTGQVCLKKGRENKKSHLIMINMIMNQSHQKRELNKATIIKVRNIMKRNNNKNNNHLIINNNQES